MRYLIDFDANERFYQPADLAVAEIVFYADLHCIFGSECFWQLVDEDGMEDNNSLLCS